MNYTGNLLSDVSMKEETFVTITGNGQHWKDNNDRSDRNVSTRLLSYNSDSGTGLRNVDQEAQTRFVPNDSETYRVNENHPQCDDKEFVIEQELIKPLIYRISQNPPLHLLILFGLQQSLLSTSAVSVTLMLSEIVCAQKDDLLKTQILSASFFMAGLSTFVMTTFGVRLPIFQMPAPTYVIPFLAMSALSEWKCPPVFEAINPADNTTILMANIDNSTIVPAREISLQRISMLSGSLMLAGVIHFLIGVTGLVGILLRFIGPVTIVPTCVLVVLQSHKIIVKWCETNWLVAVLTCVASFTLSLYLSNKKTPIPMWSRGRGFYILWYPLHQSFSVLLTIGFGWTVSVILTVAGTMTDDPQHYQYLARTDAKTHLLQQSAWFTFPYPGQFGRFSFSTAAFVICMVATVLSVLDSIGDYNACARTCRVPPPPKYAFNRGIMAEGLMSVLSGAMGSCHATISSGTSIGALVITRVVSRSVLQLCGFIYIIYAVVGKMGAIFIIIPPAVLGGTTFATAGIYIGILISSFQTINLNANRNLAIIGTSLLLGFVMPYWVQSRPDALDTGNNTVNDFIKMLLSNPSFVGGVFACFLDNTIPGTLRERGLLHQLNELDDEEAKQLAKSYEDGPEVYKLPFISKAFSKSKIAKYVPIFEYTGE